MGRSRRLQHAGPGAPQPPDAFCALPQNVLMAVLTLVAEDDPRNLIPAMEVNRRWRQLVQQADTWETAVVPLVDRKDRLLPYAHNIRLGIGKEFKVEQFYSRRREECEPKKLEVHREKSVLYSLTSQSEGLPPLHTLALEFAYERQSSRLRPKVVNAIIALTSLTTLRNLSVNRRQERELIPPECMAAIGRMTQLTSLAFNPKVLSDGGMPAVAVAPYLTGMMNLQYLDLLHIATPNDYLQHIAQLTNLTTLMVSTCIQDEETESAVRTTLSILTSLRHLHTLSIRALDDTELESLGQLTQLRRLSCDFYYFVGEHFPALLSLTNLTALTLLYFKQPDQQPTTPLPPLNYPGGAMQLRHLHMSGGYFTIFDSVCKLSCLTTLESLTLDTHVPDCLTASALSHLSRLTRVELTYVELTEALICAIAKLQNLAELVISDAHPNLFRQHVGNRTFPFPLGALSSLKHLARLKLSDMEANPAEVSSLSCCKSLTAIELDDVVDEDGSKLCPKVLSCLTTLQSFSMTCGSTPTWHHMSALIHLTSLQHFGFSHELNVSAHSRLAALSCLTRLQVLDATSTGMGAGVVPALAALSSLHTLKLGKNLLGAASPASVAQLHLLTHITGLKVLDLSQNHLTPSHGPGLAQLTQLQKLVLCKNQLGYEGVVELVALSQLRLLDVRGNNVGHNISKHMPWTKLTRSAQSKRFTSWCNVMIDPDVCHYNWLW